MLSKILLINFINLVYQVIFWIMFVRIILTWFPNINWYNQPFYFLKSFTDPILEPFRKIIPPIGGIDISPLGAFFALYVAKYIFVNIIIIL